MAGMPTNARQKLVLNKVLDGMKGKLTSAKSAAIGKCSADTTLRDFKDLLARWVRDICWSNRVVAPMEYAGAAIKNESSTSQAARKLARGKPNVLRFRSAMGNKRCLFKWETTGTTTPSPIR